MLTPSDESITTSATASDNPLLQKLGADQFRASVRFYEADQKLTETDREQIAEDLKSILLKTNFVGYGSSIVGFLLPTAYYRFKGIKIQPIAAPGMKPYTPLVQRPFLSFLMGLTTLLVANQQAAKYQFQQKLNSYRDTYTESNQADAWKAMDYHQSGLFYLYYLRTAKDPSFIIKDPRTYSKEQQHQVRVVPPRENRSHFLESLGLGHRKSEDHASNEPHVLSQWDKIRVANGFEIAPVESTPEKEVDSDISGDSDVSDVVQDETRNAPVSSWERIRKGSK